jgi:hypothetical protein
MQLPPHSAHAGLQVDPDLGLRRTLAVRHGRGPGHARKGSQDVLRNEARARSVDVAITARRLAVGEEALWRDQMQRALCPRHGDVEQPALFLDLLALARLNCRRVFVGVNFQPNVCPGGSIPTIACPLGCSAPLAAMPRTARPRAVDAAGLPLPRRTGSPRAPIVHRRS